MYTLHCYCIAFCTAADMTNVGLSLLIKPRLDNRGMLVPASYPKHSYRASTVVEQPCSGPILLRKCPRNSSHSYQSLLVIDPAISKLQLYTGLLGYKILDVGF